MSRYDSPEVKLNWFEKRIQELKEELKDKKSEEPSEYSEEEICEIKSELSYLTDLSTVTDEKKQLFHKLNTIGKLIEEVFNTKEQNDLMNMFQYGIINHENCSEFFNGISCTGWSTSSLECY